MLPSRRFQLRALVGFFTMAAVLGAFLWLFSNMGSRTLFYVSRAGLMASASLLGWELYRSVASRTGLAVCISFAASFVLQVIENVSAWKFMGNANDLVQAEAPLHLTITFPTSMLLLFTIGVVSRIKIGWRLFLFALTAIIVGVGLLALVNYIDTVSYLSWQSGRLQPSLLVLSALMLVPLIFYIRLYVGRGSSLLLGICIYLLLVLLNAGRINFGARTEEISQLADLLAHAAIPFGFALDGLDAISRTRITDENEVDPSQRDPLTRVYNRRALDAIGSTTFDDSLKAAQPVSVLMFDIDHFKKVNDVHGHAAGDAVLRQFANILQRNVRGTDFVARYGGEEFIAVLPSAPLAPAIRLAERTRSNVEETEFIYEGKRLKLTVSIGAATAFPDEPRTFQELIDNADKNLYRAKRTGRNRVLADAIGEALIRSQEE